MRSRATVQSPAAFARQHLTRAGLRTRLADVSYLFTLSPQEEADGLTASDVQFGFLPGNFHRYNAVGDGEADDTEAVQTAVRIGGHVHALPGKTYLITAPAYLTVSNTRLELTGSTIEQATAAQPWLIIGRTSASTDFVKTDHVTIIGGSAEGSVLADGDPAYGVSIIGPAGDVDDPYVRGDGCSHISIDALHSSGFTGGFIASGADDIKIRGCVLGGMIYHIALGAGGYGLLFQTCFDISITGGCLFKAEAGDRHAIYVSADGGRNYSNTNICKGVTIQGNLFDWTGTAGVTGFEAPIEIRSAEVVSVNANEIYGGYGGIEYDATNGFGAGVSITNNVIRNTHAKPLGSQRNAIAVSRSEGTFSTTDVVITGNTIQFNDSLVNGINIGQCSVVNVAGNTVTMGDGIDAIIVANADRVMVGANIVSASNGGAAVALAGTVTNVTINKGQHSGTLGSEYRIYGGAAITDLKYGFERTAVVGWAAGVPTLTDPYGLIEAAVSDAEGFTLTFNEDVNVSYQNLSLTLAASSVAAACMRAIAAQDLTVGVKDFSGAQMPAATNDYSIVVTVKS